MHAARAAMTALVDEGFPRLNSMVRAEDFLLVIFPEGKTGRLVVSFKHLMRPSRLLDSLNFHEQACLAHLLPT